MFRRLFAAATALGLAAAGLIAVAPAAHAKSRVQITKVSYDIPGKDTPVTNKKLNKEWVRLTNTSRDTISMKGWTLSDRGNKHTYVFGNVKIGPKKTKYVQTGKGKDTAKHKYWGLGYYVWNNTGDTATLRNSVGTKLDSCKWGNGNGVTYC